jgi:uncharacterized protein
MSGRMLSYNVAGLLRAVPGTARLIDVTLPGMPIADDVELAGPIQGALKLSRTGRGIIARGHLDTALVEQCSRCLAAVVAPIAVEIEEEALPTIDINTGMPVQLGPEDDAILLDDHHELDLQEAVREAISLAEPIAPLCRPDCRGLCLTCGTDLNADPAHTHDDDEIDPRMAGLAAMLDRLG